jgi:hypothetical protein
MGMRVASAISLMLVILGPFIIPSRLISVKMMDSTPLSSKFFTRSVAFLEVVSFHPEIATLPSLASIETSI